MATTINREKVGTLEYVARAFDLIPLDDETACGNMGLEGFDEDGENRTFKSKAAAVAWLRRRARAETHMRQGTVTEVEWIADDFHDRHYGLVLDAYDREIRCWYYWVEDDRGLRFEDETTC